MDIYTKEKRSEIMSRIHGKDTTPEIAVRRLIWSMGYRYRISYNKLPGKPDIVFIARKKAIFVNGCFWHFHEGCSISNIPKTNTEFWMNKFRKNKTRDIKNYNLLDSMGWKYLVIWECEIKKKNIDLLKEKIISFLGK